MKSKTKTYTFIGKSFKVNIPRSQEENLQPILNIDYKFFLDNLSIEQEQVIDAVNSIKDINESLINELQPQYREAITESCRAIDKLHAELNEVTNSIDYNRVRKQLEEVQETQSEVNYAIQTLHTKIRENEKAIAEKEARLSKIKDAVELIKELS